MKRIVWLLIGTNLFMFGWMIVASKNAFLRGHLEGTTSNVLLQGSRSLRIARALKSGGTQEALSYVNQDINDSLSFLTAHEEMLQGETSVYVEMKKYSETESSQPLNTNKK